jgi:ABC-type multidrug transport system fused ATPase/permease subunit
LPILVLRREHYDQQGASPRTVTTTVYVIPIPDIHMARETDPFRLTIRLFTNILAQEVAFFDGVTSGSLISRLTADTALLKNVATQNLSMALRGVATAIIGLAFMFSTSYKLTLVVVGAFPPLIAVAMWQGRRLRVLSRLTQTALAEATAVAEDSMGAIRTVRAFAREEDESAHFSRSVDKALAVEMQVRMSGFPKSATHCLRIHDVNHFSFTITVRQERGGFQRRVDGCDDGGVGGDVLARSLARDQRGHDHR